MTAVVLRCRNCGTTQNHPGECDACLDGQVQYFCGNHDPGLWLDQPACSRCGARFGEPPPRPVPPRAPTPRPPAGAGAGPVRPRSRTSDPRAPITRRTTPPAREHPDDATSLAELLTDMLDERTRAGARVEEAPPPEPMPMPMPDIRRMAGPVMGCLGRLVLLVLLLIALAVGAAFMLLGGG